MVPEAHVALQRWAEWSLAPTLHTNLGFGKSIEAKIQEGMGQILPGSTNRGIYIDLQSSKVESWIGKQPKDTRRLIRVFYLGVGTSDDKAKVLGLATRTMYDRLHLAHIELARHLLIA